MAKARPAKLPRALEETAHAMAGLDVLECPSDPRTAGATAAWAEIEATKPAPKPATRYVETPHNAVDVLRRLRVLLASPADWDPTRVFPGVAPWGIVDALFSIGSDIWWNIPGHFHCEPGKGPFDYLARAISPPDGWVAKAPKATKGRPAQWTSFNAWQTHSTTTHTHVLEAIDRAIALADGEQ